MEAAIQARGRRSHFASKGDVVAPWQNPPSGKRLAPTQNPTMITWLNYPAFSAYAIASLVLCANLVFLWVYSGTVRARTGTATNPEDSVQYHAALSESDPPAVARVLRAHRNAEANIYPFLLLGLVFVLAGGSATTAWILFGIFSVARLLHTVAYLGGKQPWRSVFFGIGGLALIALMVCIIVLLVHPHATA